MSDIDNITDTEETGVDGVWLVQSGGRYGEPFTMGVYDNELDALRRAIAETGTYGGDVAVRFAPFGVDLEE